MTKKTVHMLDRRWDTIKPGAVADCGQFAHIELTTDIRMVTCKACLRVFRPEDHEHQLADGSAPA